jgi:hypothetical protein
MSKYYLLSPAKLKVKDANGWLELSKDDLLRTLDCLDGGQGSELQLPKIDGKLPVYNDHKAAKAAAIAACEEDPSSQHVIFSVELSKSAKKELKAALAQHYKEGGDFYYRLPYSELFLSEGSLSHVSDELPSYELDDSKSLQERLNKGKGVSSGLNKSLLFNSFLLLMLTFFTIGFIFAYSGVTAAIAGSLIKIGLLQSGSVAMSFGITATTSLLLWDACFIALFVGNKVLKFGQTQYERFQSRNSPSTESTEPTLQLGVADEYGFRLAGFEEALGENLGEGLTDVKLSPAAPPPILRYASASGSPSYIAMPVDELETPSPAKSALSRLRFW